MGIINKQGIPSTHFYIFRKKIQIIVKNMFFKIGGQKMNIFCVRFLPKYQ